MSYADDRADAAAMLAEDGQVMTLTYPAASPTYNPATGTATGTPPDPQSVVGAIFPLNAFRKAQGNIVLGDQQVLLAAQNTAGASITAPPVNSVITDANGDAWTLIEVEPLSPAGIDVLHDGIVRRAA